jgi:UV DNA damage endonuclease
MEHSFNTSRKRLGFCCKVVHPNPALPAKQRHEFEALHTERGTTAAWLSRQPPADAELRLWEIANHNAAAAKRLVRYAHEHGHGMVRLGSSQLPMATHPDWRYFWEDPAHEAELARMYDQVGTLARNLDVRLSFHPGPFVVLASDNPEIVGRSIDEFEYHAKLARWMGYGATWQDFKCNVHISGRRGAEGIIAVLPKLSLEARNIITIENDEFSWGLDESLKLVEHVPLVLDIHHHFIHDGEYIQPDDHRVARVKESWRGVRPAIHYSYSREEHFPNGYDCHSQLWPLDDLVAAGAKRTKLRAHSDFLPNQAANLWALRFWDEFDIQVEAKMKNLATQQLYETSVGPRQSVQAVASSSSSI